MMTMTPEQNARLARLAAAEAEREQREADERNAVERAEAFRKLAAIHAERDATLPVLQAKAEGASRESQRAYEESYARGAEFENSKNDFFFKERAIWDALVRTMPPIVRDEMARLDEQITRQCARYDVDPTAREAHDVSVRSLQAARDSVLALAVVPDAGDPGADRGDSCIHPAGGGLGSGAASVVRRARG